MESLETVAEWPDLFGIYRFKDGRCWVMLHGKLEKHYETLSPNISIKTCLLMDALAMLSRIKADELKAILEVIWQPSEGTDVDTTNCKKSVVFSDNLHETLSNVISLVDKMIESLGLDLQMMCYLPDRAKNTTSPKRLIRSFTKAITAWSNRFIRPNKENKKVKLYQLKSGDQEEQCSVYLPAYAVKTAYRFVEDRHDLPKQSDIKNALISRVLGIEKKPPSFWSQLWSDAGLTGLEASKPWDIVKKKLSI